MSKDYGTPNFHKPMISISARSLDERAEEAKFKRDLGIPLTWAESWLLRDYIGGILVEDKNEETVT